MILNLEEFLKYIPKKKAYVLFGEKLTYSVSKEIHDRAFLDNGIDAEYFYVELKKDEVKPAFLHLKKYFCGANVTIPYKLDFLNLVDELDDTAKRINSVNTIKIENGKAFGYNTDILGILDSLELDKINISSKKVALLGYGGTANVVSDILASRNASITIFGRNLEKAHEFKKNILKNFPKTSIDVKTFDEFSDDFFAIFNTTPIGMNSLEGVCPILNFKNAKYAFDVIYNPLETEFLRLARSYGIKVRNGLNMLIKQALYAEKIWNNIDISQSKDLEVHFMIDVFNKRLKDKNIVLYGFMGCGKSTISKKLAKLTGKEYVDTDSLIEKNEGMKISEIFEKHGEAYFRNLEIELSKNLGCGKIIATGGGFLLNNSVYENLKDNSTFIFLDTDFKDILKRVIGDKNRPLANKSSLKELYDTRYPKYKAFEDINISKKATPYKLSLEIIRKV